MHKKKFHFGWVLVFVLVLLASQLFASGSGAGRLNDFSARASEMTGLSAYLPLVIREFPGTPTAFGIDLGAIKAGNGSNQMVQAGSDWVRRDGVDWAAVEPNKGDRNWSAIAGLEADLVNAYKSGLTPIVVVSGTPAWAQKYSGYGQLLTLPTGKFIPLASYLKCHADLDNCLQEVLGNQQLDNALIDFLQQLRVHRLGLSKQDIV